MSNILTKPSNVLFGALSDEEEALRSALNKMPKQDKPNIFKEGPDETPPSQ